jgi:hypothetical protein
MERTVMMVIMCAALATPLMARADDQPIPPEAQWTPTPPARSTVEVNQLASVLVDHGMITRQAHTLLTLPQASSPSQPSRARVWTWDEIDHHPVRSTGGD